MYLRSIHNYSRELLYIRDYKSRWYWHVHDAIKSDFESYHSLFERGKNVYFTIIYIYIFFFLTRTNLNKGFQIKFLFCNMYDIDIHSAVWSLHIYIHIPLTIGEGHTILPWFVHVWMIYLRIVFWYMCAIWNKIYRAKEKFIYSKLRFWRV